MFATLDGDEDWSSRMMGKDAAYATIICVVAVQGIGIVQEELTTSCKVGLHCTRFLCYGIVICGKLEDLDKL